MQAPTLKDGRTDKVAFIHSNATAVRNKKRKSLKQTLACPNMWPIVSDSAQVFDKLKALLKAIPHRSQKKKPVIDFKISFGFNEISRKKFDLVFVCKSDIQPKALVHHLPYTIDGLLVELPCGSSAVLSEMLGFRVSFIGISECPQLLSFVQTMVCIPTGLKRLKTKQV